MAAFHMTDGPMRRTGSRSRQRGSSLGEQAILLALTALVVTLALATFSHSVVAGVCMIVLGVVSGALVFGIGAWRDRRSERRREAMCLAALGRAAGQPLDATFVGRGQGGPAAFGIVGAERKLVHARDSSVHIHATAVGFDDVAAAFAREDGTNGYRLEVRVRRDSDRSLPEALFLTTGKRDEAERWVTLLAPHLGARAKMVGPANADAAR